SKEEEFKTYTTARTNERAVERLQELFPELQVHGLELVKSDIDPMRGVLHLDCCFQPIGTQEAIIYENGFKHKQDVDYLKDLFGEKNLIKVGQEEFYQMFPNIFSIDTDIIVSNRSFIRLNSELEKRGYKVEQIPYDEVAKMGGLLRCSTMPIYRENQ
ncbi:MAG: amidinotransferase, partial [Flavobacteriales bacterium]|nr:amidinotransferase [Flavobacteriales bacterium]